jgi:hypothetical protein
MIVPQNDQTLTPGLLLATLALLVLSLVLFLTLGCSALRDRTPVTESVTLSLPPVHAYDRAVQAMMQMGVTITRTDATFRLLVGEVHNAVVLTVLLTPLSEGVTGVSVTGQLLPNKLVTGEFTEVADYLKLLR